jgi:hypothetical protein
VFLRTLSAGHAPQHFYGLDYHVRAEHVWVQIKIVNFVLVDVLFFQLKWNVSVLESFGVPFLDCIVHIYIYIYIYIQQT